jgi:hypothetical protein
MGEEGGGGHALRGVFFYSSLHDLFADCITIKMPSEGQLDNGHSNIQI